MPWKNIRCGYICLQIISKVGKEKKSVIWDRIPFIFCVCVNLHESDLCWGSYCAAWCSACKASVVLFSTEPVNCQLMLRHISVLSFALFFSSRILLFLCLFEALLSLYFRGCLHLLPSEVSRPHVVQPCGFTTAATDHLFIWTFNPTDSKKKRKKKTGLSVSSEEEHTGLDSIDP